VSGRFGILVSRDPSHLLQNGDLTEPDVTIAAQPLLNGALNEDTLDDGWVRITRAVILGSLIGEQILAISIYCESSDINEKSFGKRAKVYPGKAPLRKILQAEVAGEHIEKKPVDNVDWDTKTLVEGGLESWGQSGRDGQLLVTGEFPSLSFWP
jgi:hypothetical protein